MQTEKPVRYQMVKSTMRVEDSGIVTTYGISCRTDAEANLNSPGDHETILDISTQPDLVEKLVESLNRHGVDPIHLKDIIYDSLP